MTLLALMPLGLRVQDAWWLLLVPALLLPALWSLRDLALLSPLRRWTSIVLRAALVSLIALALAGLALTRQTDRLAVVAIVDTSESVRRLAGAAQFDAIGRFLDASLLKRGTDDVLGVVAVGARPTAIASPTSAGLGGRSLDMALGSGTNLEAGLRLARAMVPSDARARLILISDGNQTSGDALATARAMAGQISIDVVPVRVSASREARIDAVEAPQTAAAGASVTVRVVLFATTPTTGVLRLLSEDALGADPAPLASRRVSLAAGRSIETFEVPLREGRVHRFVARLDPDAISEATGAPPADTIADNNEGRAFTITPGQGRVLLIEGNPAPTAPPLSRVLDDAGYAVDRIGAASAPADLVSAQAYDLVILDNVPADALSPAAIATLVAHVRDLGAGLIMLGGRESFGAGGYKGTPIEPILPVSLELPERLVEPETAVVLVLDNSGSMHRGVMGSSRSQQAIANEAAASAILSLDPRDLVGVVVFNSDYEVLVPLGPNANPKSSAQRVLGINSDGGTNLPPALDEAAKQLAPVTAKSKSIIVLTDGISMGKEELSAQAEQYRKAGILVSAIAVGDDADREGMKAMAEAGGGTFFDVRNPMTLPRILVKAVRVMRSPLVREQPFTPRVVDPASPLLRGVSEFPALGGLSLTQPRTGATVSNVLASDAGDPVLASWNVELGRVLAFTSDASRWARAWLDWPGYRTFWLQVVRATSRPAAPAEVRAELAPGATGRLTVRATLERGRDAGSADAAIDATVYAPDGTSRTLALSQVGPRQFEGSIDAGEAGTYFAIARPKVGGKARPAALAGASVGNADEFQRLTTNLDLLRSIATTTGGRVLGEDVTRADASVVFDRGGVPPRVASLPLWPALLPWIVVLAMADIACRRVAWDRWLVRTKERPQVAMEQSRSLDRLRDAPAANAAEPSLTLGADEAKRLVDAARDRRRAERLRGIRPVPVDVSAPPAASVPSQPTTVNNDALREGESDLLRAKRRAREKFEEG